MALASGSLSRGILHLEGPAKTPRQDYQHLSGSETYFDILEKRIIPLAEW